MSALRGWLAASCLATATNCAQADRRDDAAVSDALARDAHVDTGTVATASDSSLEVGDGDAKTLAPVFTPIPGDYLGCKARPGPAISIASATTGATIRFTTDGSDPTAESPTFGPPLLLTESMILRAVAIAPGHAPSAVAEARYGALIPGEKVPTVTLSPAPGSYSTGVEVVLASSSASAIYCYTLNGAPPSCRDDGDVSACVPPAVRYVAPIMLRAMSGGTTVRAIGCKPFCVSASDVSAGSYVLE
jgi:hypothetical protein